jgi:cytochrome c oxidase assembly factor CtaG
MIMVAAAAVVPPASAHGGKSLVTAETGAYRASVSALLVRLSPTRSVVDFTTYLERRRGGWISDAHVVVEARVPDGASQTLQALRQGGTYQVLVPVPAGVDWRRIRLQVRIDGREGAAAFAYAPPSLASQWEIAPVVLGGAALLVALFAQAFVRLRRRGRRDHASWGRALLFGTGVAVGGVALVSPLDPVGEQYLLSGHMLQHVAITDAAPALVVTSLRGPLLFFLLPPALLRPLARLRLLRALGDLLLRPAVAVALWAIVIAVWHVPSIYDFTLTHRLVHDLEHALFVLVGVLVWAQLVDPARRGRLGRPGRILVGVLLFAMGTVLSDVLIFSFRPLYPSYAEQGERLLGLTPERDQQVAGLVMMVEQVVTLGTALVLLARPYLERERRDRAARVAPAAERQLQ